MQLVNRNNYIDENLEKYNLEKEGYKVSYSDNGNDGIKEIKKKLPDLILLDWMLPDFSGVEICKNLKKDIKFKDLPIIMLTAKGEKEDKEKQAELDKAAEAKRIAEEAAKKAAAEKKAKEEAEKAAKLAAEKEAKAAEEKKEDKPKRKSKRSKKSEE